MTMQWSLYHRPCGVGMGWRLYCNPVADSGRDAINQEFTDNDVTGLDKVYWGNADGSPEKPASVWGTCEACFLPFRSHEWLKDKAKLHGGNVELNCGLPGIRLSYGKFIRVDELIIREEEEKDQG